MRGNEKGTVTPKRLIELGFQSCRASDLGVGSPFRTERIDPCPAVTHREVEERIPPEVGAKPKPASLLSMVADNVIAPYRNSSDQAMNPTRVRMFDGASGLILATAGSVTWADTASQFEASPEVAGAQLAPAALLRGTGYDVAEPVRVDRFMGRFELRSAYGTFQVSGVDMLTVRVHELGAIEELPKVETSGAFTEALAKSVGGTAKFVGTLVSDPGKTVENVAAGAGTVLGRIGYSVRSGVQNAGDAITGSASPKPEQTATAAGGDEPLSFTGDPFGYNYARREWAKKLGIDPYTTNPVLRPLLDDAASAYRRMPRARSFAIDGSRRRCRRPSSQRSTDCTTQPAATRSFERQPRSRARFRRGFCCARSWCSPTTTGVKRRSSRSGCAASSPLVRGTTDRWWRRRRSITSTGTRRRRRSRRRRSLLPRGAYCCSPARRALARCRSSRVSVGPSASRSIRCTAADAHAHSRRGMHPH